MQKQVALVNLLGNPGGSLCFSGGNPPTPEGPPSVCMGIWLLLGLSAGQSPEDTCVEDITIEPALRLWGHSAYL